MGCGNEGLKTTSEDTFAALHVQERPLQVERGTAMLRVQQIQRPQPKAQGGTFLVCGNECTMNG